MLGNFSCFLLSAYFLKIKFFWKNSFRNTIWVSNRLDLDQARQNVWTDLGPICLQRLSADRIMNAARKTGKLQFSGHQSYLSQDMRYPIMWYVQPAEAQTSKGSDQPAHTRSLIRAYASPLNILLTEQYFEFLSLKGGCTGSSESTLVKMPHCWKSHVTAHFSRDFKQYNIANYGFHIVHKFIMTTWRTTNEESKNSWPQKHNALQPW